MLNVIISLNKKRGKDLIGKYKNLPNPYTKNKEI